MLNWRSGPLQNMPELPSKLSVQNVRHIVWAFAIVNHRDENTFADLARVAIRSPGYTITA